MDTYEKKYKEAKRLYETANADQRYVLESLFPELAESEDERIRKMLISLVKNWDKDGIVSKYTSDANDIKQILAWLEKQWQKPQRIISAEAKEAMYDRPAWSEEDEVKVNRIIGCLENLNVADNDILLKDVDWLNSLKERYTWKPSDEQMEILDMILTNESMDDNIARILRELREQLKKLREE